MMKITRVFVEGELPEGCFECDLMSAVLPPSCQAFMTNGQFTLIPNVYTRHPWCPLTLENACHDVESIYDELESEK